MDDQRTDSDSEFPVGLQAALLILGIAGVVLIGTGIVQHSFKDIANGTLWIAACIFVFERRGGRRLVIRRHSARTILIAITVVAVMLGWFVWASH
jgi:hypothetical protein